MIGIFSLPPDEHRAMTLEFAIFRINFQYIGVTFLPMEGIPPEGNCRRFRKCFRLLCNY
jgi:hypothetical protein